MSGKTIDSSALTTPATDATSNANLGYVIGSKADTPTSTGTAANATLSLIAYIKGLWNLLRGVTWANLDAAISSVATSTWTITTRNLTRMGPAESSSTVNYSTIANGSQLDVRPGANISRDITVGYIGNTTGLIELWDGAFSVTAATSAGSTHVCFSFLGTNSNIGVRINNNGAGIAHYMYCVRDHVM